MGFHGVKVDILWQSLHSSNTAHFMTPEQIYGPSQPGQEQAGMNAAGEKVSLEGWNTTSEMEAS
eukprot:443770-Pelagomonas_calceolata.AAC.2